MKKFLDNIATWATVISAVYLILGLLRATFYYMPFGIPIYTFIDFGEIFTTWFPHSIYILIICSLLTFLYPVVDYFKPEHGGEFTYYFSSIYITHIASLFYIFFDLLLNSFGNHSAEWRVYTGMNYSILFIISAVFGFLSISGLWDMIAVLRKKKINDIFNRVRGFIIVTILIITAFVWSVTQPIGIEMTSKEYTKIILINDKDTLTTNENLRYLGNTRNYIFLWNKKEKRADVYKLQDYPKISFGRFQ